MATLNIPNVNLTLEAAPTPVSNSPQRTLLIGQMDQAVGTATPNTLVQNIGLSGDTLFGIKSTLATMVRAYRRVDTVNSLDAFVMEQIGGTPAIGDIVLVNAGVATEAGTATVVVLSEKLHTFKVPVSIGDSNVTFLTNLETLVNANAEILVTALVTLDTITFTHVEDGDIGNDGSFLIKNLPAGLAVDTVNRLASGSDTTIMDALETSIEAIRYQSMSAPFIALSLTVTGSGAKTLLELMAERFNETNAIDDGVVFVQKTDTATAVLADVVAFNNLNLVLFGTKLVTPTPTASEGRNGSALLELDIVTSTYFCATRSLLFTPGYDISRFLVGNNLNSKFGGVKLAVIPYQNTPFIHLPVITDNVGWTTLEQSALRAGGVSFFGNNPSKTGIIVGTVYTTYQTNKDGLSDDTFKRLSSVDCAVNAREYIFNNLKQDFAQVAMTLGNDFDGGINEGDFTNTLLTYYKTISDPEFSLSPSGDTFNTFFLNNLTIVSFNVETSTIDFTMKLLINGQLDTINGVIDVSLSV